MKIIKEFTEPTTIIITGQWVDGIKESLMLTDDECGIDVRCFNGKTISLTTFGIIHILTLDQFNWFVTSDHYKMHCDDDFGNQENMYIVIKDYIGVIGATGIMDHNKEFDKWDINDYFYHQVKDSVLVLDVKGEYDFNAMNVNEVKEFLDSGESSKAGVEEVSPSLEERIEVLEKKIESMQKQITLHSGSIDWCERNIK